MIGYFENTLSNNIKQLAANHGFALCQFAQPQVGEKFIRNLDRWIDAGFECDMVWMSEAQRVAMRKNPAAMLDDVKTVISVALPYLPPAHSLGEGAQAGQQGVISAYAYGEDYHDVMKKKLKALARELDDLLGKHDQRVYVDTAPVLEHAFAERSGLGWQGKHSLSIHRKLGSWFLLGEIFTTAVIEPDAPARFHCGSCTACICECPTQAIVAPFMVDARRCISYLTIEFHGFIAPELRSLMGNRIYGCDDCQMVCPWNSKAKPVTLDMLSPRPENILPSLAELFVLDEAGFRQRFSKSPIKRTKRPGLLRNVAIAMGNSGDAAFIPMLIEALADDEPLIQGHSAWALAQLFPYSQDGEIERALRYHAGCATHPQVLAELQSALNTIGISKDR